MEIGPGLGFLTTKLAQKVKKVIAIELDPKLYNTLKESIKKQNIKNIEIINADILQYFFKLNLEHYKIVSNLPYNITSIFLRKVFELKNKPKSMTLMLQKEVAERISAKPSKLSVLAISVQLYCLPKIIEIIPKNYFWPEPKVNSAIIYFDIKNNNASYFLDKDQEKKFFRLVKVGFSSKRKMLKNNLASGFRITTKQAEDIIKKAEFNEKVRAQELSIADWEKLLSLINLE